MERVREILRALFRRVLSDHGREPPTLTDVFVEGGTGWLGPQIGVVFSNGYRAWAPLQRSDEWRNSEELAAWELPSRRRAVCREAHLIYAEVLSAHRLELRQQRRSRIAQQIERLAQSFRPRRESALFFTVGRRLFDDEGSAEAQERGMRLLKENLSPLQREQYEKHRYFEVIGGRTGRRYRIRHGRMMNIDQLDAKGRQVCGWCFFPEGHLVAGDVMLAQKLALELFEAEALEVANRF
ncbi:MAG TPA: hypothetical protein VNK52_14980 [Hyphomicrobiaceae bacterium]|nr:hypothetical protein [Hyphomicrobiaceae bacterium]